MKDHNKEGNELVHVSRISMWIGVAVSLLLVILSIVQTNGKLLCTAFIIAVGIVLVCKLLEAAGHIIVLLNEQAENSKQIVSLLKNHGLERPALQTTQPPSEPAVPMKEESADEQSNDQEAIDEYIEELQSIFRKDISGDTTYSIVKDDSNNNQIIITKEVQKLASKINYIGENYMDSWTTYVKTQKNLVQSVSDQMRSCGIREWTVLFHVVDSSIDQKMLSICDDEIIYDFMKD